MTMTSTFTKMEDIQLSEDWQLEPSLGLTLFDDPWKGVDFESTGLKDVVDSTSDYDCIDQLFDDLPQSDLAESFCEDWMENADITDMLQSLVQDSEALQEMDFVDYMPPVKETVTELKGSDILRSLIEQGLKQTVSMSPEAQVAPTISLIPAEDEDDVLGSSVSTIEMSDVDDIMQSPLSADDVDSLLSGPSSPSDSPCSELQAMLLDNSCVSSSKSSTRSTPYSTESGHRTKSKVKGSKLKDVHVEYLSKKDKKKLQNKNAAIRYRQKKKQEAEVVKDDESDLASKNKDLNDKVDQLSREIQYMKDLMAEVYKAKGVIK